MGTDRGVENAHLAVDLVLSDRSGNELSLQPRLEPVYWLQGRRRAAWDAPRRVYLSGPMTGCTDWNAGAFRRVAETLRNEGAAVFSPAELGGGDTSRPRCEYMRADLLALLAATEVQVLPGYLHSRGACLEVLMACEVGIPVLEYGVGRTDEASPVHRPSVMARALGNAWNPPLNEAEDPLGAAMADALGTMRVVPPWQEARGGEDAVESCLQEAERLVYGDRGAAYGHPAEDYAATGAMWGALLARWAVEAAAHREGADLSAAPLPVPAHLATLCMAAVKLSRECRVPARDNRVDLAGYAECADRVARASGGEG